MIVLKRLLGLVGWIAVGFSAALWSSLFFGLHRLDIAFFDIVVLWLVILCVVVLFWRVNRGAGALLRG